MAQPDEIVSLLSKVELFRGLDTGVLGAIVPRMSEEVFHRGAVLFHEGDHGDRLYVLLTGKVRVYVERLGSLINYDVLEAGTCFGEMALIEAAPRSATVRAELPCRCLTLGQQDFLELLQMQPRMALTILRDLSLRLRHTNTQIQEFVKQLMALSKTPI
jgi:CRP-like cAMP-binding protein